MRTFRLMTALVFCGFAVSMLVDMAAVAAGFYGPPVLAFDLGRLSASDVLIITGIIAFLVVMLTSPRGRSKPSAAYAALLWLFAITRPRAAR